MKKLAFGVDIGGINTAFGLVDENGDLYAESVISTKKYPSVDDYPAYVEDLCQAMHALADSLSFEYELTGIGIGAPNANYHKGTVENPANLWKFREGDPNPDESRRIFPLADDIRNCFGGVKVLVTNDANAATIGEMIYGNAKGMRDFIMITLGTGLGSGFVANGEMIYGHDGFAGEFGHVIVERDGREERFTIPFEQLVDFRRSKGYEEMLMLRTPFRIDSVASPAALDAGLRAGDEVVALNGERHIEFAEYVGLLADHKSSDVQLTVVRGDSTAVLTVPVNADGKIGVTVARHDYRLRTKEYTFWQSIPAGIRRTGSVIANYWEQLKLIVQPKTQMYEELGGFIAIGSIFPSAWNWQDFWSKCAFISIILAIMNILPIPGLDGGHAIFTLWEMITGRKPSDRFLEAAQYVGLAIILVLLVYANGNDIYRFFIK